MSAAARAPLGRLAQAERFLKLLSSLPIDAVKRSVGARQDRRRSEPCGSGSNMDNEIQLISDRDGLAVIGEPNAVETFLRAERLWDVSKKFDLADNRCDLLGPI
jgi:hypothetical protein